MTVFVQVKESDGSEGPALDAWKPWVNCEPLDRVTVRVLALRQFIRFAGGISPADPVRTFTVWDYTDECPKHPNGRPAVVCATTFNAHPET